MHTRRSCNDNRTVRLRGYGQADWPDMYPRNSKARQDMRRSDKRRERMKARAAIRAEVDA